MRNHPESTENEDPIIAALLRRARLSTLYETVSDDEVPAAKRYEAESMAAHASAWLKLAPVPRIEWLRPARPATWDALVRDGAVADGEKVFDLSEAPIPPWSAWVGMAWGAGRILLLAQLRQDDVATVTVHETVHCFQAARGMQLSRVVAEQQANYWQRAFKAWWLRDMIWAVDRASFLAAQPTWGKPPEALSRRLVVEDAIARPISVV